ncbi:MAG: mannitol dehydrogenase family protein [Thiolinea sp.]
MTNNKQTAIPLPLSDKTLSALPADIVRPDYDRTRLTPGIIHIGLGNFHRAHQAWYLHQLMQRGLALDWAIVGAGVRPYDETMRQKMVAQDYLTTLIELDPSGTSAEVVGSMIDYVPITEGNQPLIERMASADIRIVALTVTEGGYYIDPATKGFDATHPDIVHDAENPEAPCTAFGAMVAALKLRRERGIGSFTGLCCDNLQGNGAILRQTVVSLARLSDPELADWISVNCSFPNSMVDCIVPATGPNEIAMARGFGIDDAVPVTHESFRQWVIEDDFCAGRPDWDKVGAVFTDAVHDYEAMKIRILNAGHQVLANAGELLGLETIADCMAHPVLAEFFSKVEHQEIAPHVKPVPDMQPDDYIDLIATRFANPAILDTTRRVAFDGSSRHTGFVLPILRDALASGAPVDGLSLVEALWARMCIGTREDGSIIEANDPFWETLNATALQAETTPMSWLEMSQTYGDLAEQPRFTQAFEKWSGLIRDHGVEAALQEYCR